MKKYLQFLFIGFLFFSGTQTRAQCPDSFLVTLSSQADVDAFAINYPDCTELPYLRINGEDITDLSPLINLTFLTDLEIQGTTLLTSLYGLNNVTHIQNFIDISYTSITSLEGLDNLIFIGDSIRFNNNPYLVSLSQLINISSLTYGIDIVFNNSLITLSGLDSLVSVPEIFIVGNSQLSDISALGNIVPDTIGLYYGLVIFGNLSLSVCNLPNFCTYLTYDATIYPRNIKGNAENCVSEQAVLNSCNLNIDSNEISTFQIYPNPVKDIVYFDQKVSQITVTDFSGKVLIQENDIINIDLSGFQRGIYLITLENDNQKQTKKIIKE